MKDKDNIRVIKLRELTVLKRRNLIAMGFLIEGRARHGARGSDETISVIDSSALLLLKAIRTWWPSRCSRHASEEKSGGATQPKPQTKSRRAGVQRQVASGCEWTAERSLMV
jgi:hypothetical protein